MAIKTFTTGEVLTAADTNTYLANSGMVYVASTTFSGSSGVEMQNCFSSTYDNYFVITNVYGSAGTNTSWQMMSGTNTKETTAVYNRVGFYWTSGVTNFNASAQNQWFNINHGTTSSSYSNSEMTVFRPNVSGVKTETRLRGYSGDSDLTVYIDQYSTPTVSYTGLYLFPSSGTITGTVTIYGYRKP
jgi:ABC-type Na+ efflux pump permease subunit